MQSSNLHTHTSKMESMNSSSQSASVEDSPASLVRFERNATIFFNTFDDSDDLNNLSSEEMLHEYDKSNASANKRNNTNNNITMREIRRQKSKSIVSELEDSSIVEEEEELYYSPLKLDAEFNISSDQQQQKEKGEQQQVQQQQAQQQQQEYGMKQSSVMNKECEKGDTVNDDSNQSHDSSISSIEENTIDSKPSSDNNLVAIKENTLLSSVDTNNPSDNLLAIVKTNSDNPLVLIESQEENNNDTSVVVAAVATAAIDKIVLNKQSFDDSSSNGEQNEGMEKDIKNDLLVCSTLDSLVKASSRPTFQAMLSDSILVDPKTSPLYYHDDDDVGKVVDLELHSGNNVSFSMKKSIKKPMLSRIVTNDYSLKEASQEGSSASPSPSPNASSMSSSLKEASQEEGSSASPSASSISSSSGLGSTTSSFQYKIKSKDTGKVYDIRDLKIIKSDDSEEGLQVKYTLFPSKGQLMEMHNKQVSIDDESGNFSPIKDVVVKSGRAVSKASKAITKSMLIRSKSEGTPLSSAGTGTGTGAKLLEPLPNFQEGGEDKTEDALTRPRGFSRLSDKWKRRDSDQSITKKVEIVDEKKSDIENNNESTKRDSLPSVKNVNVNVNVNSNPVNAMKRKHRRKKSTKSSTLMIPKNTLAVRCVNKSKSASDFNPMLLIATIGKAHDGPIWSSSFSKDGKYLATGGEDGVVNIWQISPTKEEYNNQSNKPWFPEEDAKWKGFWGEDTENNAEEGKVHPLPTMHSECDAIGTDIQFILPTPVQTFREHTRDITDLSWSNTGFLLSASLDNNVKLWHPTRSISLHQFRHPDGVTSVSFHPNEDRYFLSGGFDKKLRIWNINHGRVAEWAQASNHITTATFQPDAKRIAVGLIDGKVIFYSLDGLKMKYFSQMICKNRSKKFGKKVTGLSFNNLQNLSADKLDDGSSHSPEKSSKSNKSNNNLKETKRTKLKTRVKNFATIRKNKKKMKEQVLITTNDSRLRLVGLNDFCMVRKYKGHLNYNLKFKARFSESGEFIIIGSENGKCIIWNTATRRNPLNVNVTGINMYDKVKSYECFEASRANPPSVTESLFGCSRSAKDAFLNSGLFPSLNTLDHLNHDFSSAFVVTCDYGGTIRIFLRRASFDAVCHAAGPTGYKDVTKGQNGDSFVSTNNISSKS